MLRVYKNNVWSEEEERFIIDNAGAMNDEYLHEAINQHFKTTRKFSAVRKKRQRLGVKKGPGRGNNIIIKGA